MVRLIIGFVVGLIIGWNILPQPAWAKNLWNKLMAKFHKKPAVPAPVEPVQPEVVEEKPE